MLGFLKAIAKFAKSAKSAFSSAAKVRHAKHAAPKPSRSFRRAQHAAPKPPRAPQPKQAPRAPQPTEAPSAPEPQPQQPAPPKETKAAKNKRIDAIFRQRIKSDPNKDAFYIATKSLWDIPGVNTVEARNDAIVKGLGTRNLKEAYDLVMKDLQAIGYPVEDTQGMTQGGEESKTGTPPELLAMAARYATL